MVEAKDPPVMCQHASPTARQASLTGFISVMPKTVHLGD